MTPGAWFGVSLTPISSVQGGLFNPLFWAAVSGDALALSPQSKVLQNLVFEDDAMSCFSGAEVVERGVHIIHRKDLRDRRDAVTGAEVQHGSHRRGRSQLRPETDFLPPMSDNAATATGSKTAPTKCSRPSGPSAAM